MDIAQGNQKPETSEGGQHHGRAVGDVSTGAPGSDGVNEVEHFCVAWGELCPVPTHGATVWSVQVMYKHDEMTFRSKSRNTYPI